MDPLSENETSRDGDETSSAANPFGGLAEISEHLRLLNVHYAVVGALAISHRTEEGRSSKIEVVLSVQNDKAFELIVDELGDVGWETTALIEHAARGRLATARIVSKTGVNVDLIAARCGIEPEIVADAEVVTLPKVGLVPIARAEDLLAMKLLAMVDDHIEDRRDALVLLSTVADLDVDDVRKSLQLIASRQYDRGGNLERILDRLLGRPSAAPSV